MYLREIRKGGIHFHVQRAGVKLSIIQFISPTVFAALSFFLAVLTPSCPARNSIAWARMDFAESTPYFSDNFSYSRKSESFSFQFTSGISFPPSSALALSNIRGFPSAPEEIITASQAVQRRNFTANSGVEAPPFPITGISTAFFTSPTTSQPPFLLLPSVAVLQWTVIPDAPDFSTNSAIPTALSSFQPALILHVIGISDAEAQADTMAAIFSFFFRSAEPAPARITLPEGQPKFRSMQEANNSPSRTHQPIALTASRIISSLEPNIWIPTGISSLQVDRSFIAAGIFLTTAFAFANSVKHMAAPRFLQRSLKAMSV